MFIEPCVRQGRHGSLPNALLRARSASLRRGNYLDGNYSEGGAVHRAVQWQGAGNNTKRRHVLEGQWCIQGKATLTQGCEGTGPGT